MPATVTHKLLESHLESGNLTAGDEIAIRIDQTLTQDATGTLVMQELEALGLDTAKGCHHRSRPSAPPGEDQQQG